MVHRVTGQEHLTPLLPRSIPSPYPSSSAPRGTGRSRGTCSPRSAPSRGTSRCSTRICSRGSGVGKRGNGVTRGRVRVAVRPQLWPVSSAQMTRDRSRVWRISSLTMSRQHCATQPAPRHISGQTGPHCTSWPVAPRGCGTAVIPLTLACMRVLSNATTAAVVAWGALLSAGLERAPLRTGHSHMECNTKFKTQPAVPGFVLGRGFHLC